VVCGEEDEYARVSDVGLIWAVKWATGGL
jgi:hypothetical protein